MAKTANINVRIDPETKESAEKLFSSFGITITDAINIFLRKSIMEGGLPFEVKQPRYNMETEQAMNEARLIMEGRVETKHYTSAKALFDELDAEKDDDSCWN
jgi:DNA-damage-inducible protein J